MNTIDVRGMDRERALELLSARNLFARTLHEKLLRKSPLYELCEEEVILQFAQYGNYGHPERTGVIGTYMWVTAITHPMPEDYDGASSEITIKVDPEDLWGGGSNRPAHVHVQFSRALRAPHAVHAHVQSQIRNMVEARERERRADRDQETFRRMVSEKFVGSDIRFPAYYGRNSMTAEVSSGGLSVDVTGVSANDGTVELDCHSVRGLNLERIVQIFSNAATPDASNTHEFETIC